MEIAEMGMLHDKDWRMENLYSVVNKDMKSVPFNRNRAQRHFNENKTNRNVLLKSRQLGFTTDEVIDILDDTLFTPNYSGLLIAHTLEDAQKIFDKKVSFAWDNLDPQMKRLWKVDTDSANKLKFGFRDNTFSDFVVSNSGRSGTLNRVHISEFAKLCRKYPLKAQEVISGTLPSVPLDGRIDIESTAEGMSGSFHEIFTIAWDRKVPAKDFEFTAHFYNWTWDDDEIDKVKQIIPTDAMDEGHLFKEYQILHNLTDREITYYYIKWISLNKKWDVLHQEYPTTPEEAFVTSGRPVFDTAVCVRSLKLAQEHKPEVFDLEIVRERGSNKILKVEKVLNPIGYFKQFSELSIDPVADKNRFAVGTDVAEGLQQGDFSSMDVLDRKTLSYPIKWHGHIDPDLLAWEQLKLLIYLKGCAWFCTELNNHGRLTTATARDLRIPQYKRVTFEKGYEENKDVGLGFLTTTLTRPILLGYLKEELRSEGFTDYDEGFWKETLTFVKNEHGKEEAEGKSKDPNTKCFDDRIFSKALSIACHVWMPPLMTAFDEFKRKLSEEFKNKRKRSVV